MNILISEFMDETSVALLRSKFATTYDPTLVDRRSELFERLANVDALIVRNRTQVTPDLLAVAPQLKVVGRLGVGLDNIDLPACRARSVEVIPATGANALAVAEYVIATAMMLLRGAYTSTNEVTAGKWPRTALSSGREINNKTLGVIGYGGIGQLTARLAKGLGMRVLATDPMLPANSPVWAETGVICSTLEQLLADSDVVSLHVPLTPETRNFIDASRLASMKSDAVLINSSRGGIVDEAALAAALKANRLGGAALDVFDQEPLTATNVFEACPNLALTPHIAGVTLESNTRVSSMIADRVADFLTASKAGR